MLLQLAHLLERQSGTLSFVRGLAILTAVMGVAGGIVGGVAFQLYGPSAGVAGAIAAGICLLAGGIALAIATRRTPHQASGANFILLAMMVRLVIPLMVALVLLKRIDWLQEAAFIGQLVILYLIMLTTETWLSLHVAPIAPALEKGPRHG